MLLTIPVLASTGVLGDTRGVVRERTATLSVEMRYPASSRYNMIQSIHLDVTNTTAARLERVAVDIDTAYASRFSRLVAIPDFDGPYVVELSELAPGETRRVRLELRGERYGRHRGELRVSSGGADTARLRLDTFIFP